jgi:CBS domain-containing protein
MLAIEKTISDFVRDVPFATVRPDDPVSAAVALMLEKKVDAVLVTEAERPVGIFTEHDFVHRVAAAHRVPATTPIRDVMTPQPECLGPNDRMNYAINRMAIRGFRNIPIVDASGRLVAVLDVRMAMLHLLKLFAELEREGARRKGPDDWTDTGGG